MDWLAHAAFVHVPSCYLMYWFCDVWGNKVPVLFLVCNKFALLSYFNVFIFFLFLFGGWSVCTLPFSLFLCFTFVSNPYGSTLASLCRCHCDSLPNVAATHWVRREREGARERDGRHISVPFRRQMVQSPSSDYYLDRDISLHCAWWQ